MCYICYNERWAVTSHTFQCGHSLCHSCVELVKTCPFCRQEIQTLDSKCWRCKVRYPQLVKLIYLVTLLVNWLLVCTFFPTIQIGVMSIDKLVTGVLYSFFHPTMGLVEIYCFQGTWHDFYEIGIMHQVFLSWMLYTSLSSV